MKPFDIVLLALFALGAFCGGVWATTYFIPHFFPRLVIKEARGAVDCAALQLRCPAQGGVYVWRV